MSDNEEGFAARFGDALLEHLERQGKTQAEAAKQTGLQKARVSSYCRKGKRRVPSAEALYRLCAQLGLEFEFGGCKISAIDASSHGLSPIEEQLRLPFERQFELTDGAGSVSVNIRKPPGRVEVSLSLKAAGKKA